MIVGITGENCAGKTTAAEFLKRKGFEYLSLSDVIRDELKKDNKDITRQALVDMGNLLRKKYGPGALAIKTLEKIKPHKNYVVDSIRNPHEVEVLRRNDRFILLYITAPPELRFERMKSRNREYDPKTFEEFLKFERLEKENKDENKQNLSKTAQLADIKIVNDSSLEDFEKTLTGILLEKVSKLFLARPSWDEYFMRIAHMVATRSNCIKRKVAAIIVKDKRIVSTGYNGTPRGTKNCSEGGCPRCNSFADSGKKLDQCFCSHGEENAIVQAAYHGISIKGATLYTTFSPCLICTKMIINAGISEVVFDEHYPLDDLSKNLLTEAGIKLRKVNS